MNTRDRLLGITVAVLWGLNFLAIRAGLDHFPPFFFVALRFLVIAIPVLIFVRPPKVPTKWLLLYGLGFGVLQFAFLFTAMNVGMPTGLASLVLQSSAPFTVVLGALLLRERISRRQILGITVAVGGMALIGYDRAHAATLLPVMLTLLAGLGWAFGNLGNKLAARSQPGHSAGSAPTQPGRSAGSAPAQPMRLMLWMCVVPPIPMLVLSAITEGPTTGWVALADAFSADGWPALAGLAYIVVLGTLVGSGLWTILISRHPAGVVAPFSLLVPVVGIAGAWLFLDEDPSALALIGAAVVILGCLGGMKSVRVSPEPLASDRLDSRKHAST